jgi:hypothetical protein
VGEKQNQPFQLSFNASLKVDFQGSRVTSDGGLILVRELDERLGFGELIEQHLSDSRQGLNKLAPAGRRTSTPATVRGHAAADLGAAGPNRLTRVKRSCRGKKGLSMEWCPRNASERKFQSVAYRHESSSRAPEMEADATKNNLVHLGGSRVYKGGHPGGQNGNPR